MIVSSQEGEEMANERDAHFLHEKSAIEAVLSPPIERPRAIAWVGRTTKLLVATADGDVVEVDPIFGTRKLPIQVEDPAVLSVSPSGRRIVVVERGRGLVQFDAKGTRIAEVAIPLLSAISVAWFTRKAGKGAFAAVGDTLEGRKAIVLTKDFSRQRVARVPAQTVLGAGKGGTLLAARSNTDGLEVTNFGSPMRKAIPSRHRLRFSKGGVLIGMADGGVTIWRDHHESNTVMVYDVTAADASADGSLVAIGTRAGDVAFCDLGGEIVHRAHPDRVGGHSGSVREIAFSQKGRWLATSADALWLWRY
ncbi:MAG: hypothetical protein GY913_00695 [Proteobacteria bacterium]|nr:hypothetical protein [Pseudomonadota bacterium]MCP4915415.1 hypothetical protein [Pseudomonadota bacterium]